MSLESTNLIPINFSVNTRKPHLLSTSSYSNQKEEKITSFRKAIFVQKKTKSSFKTTKNSPKRALLDNLPHSNLITNIIIKRKSKHNKGKSNSLTSAENTEKIKKINFFPINNFLSKVKEKISTEQKYINTYQNDNNLNSTKHKILILKERCNSVVNRKDAKSQQQQQRLRNTKSITKRNANNNSSNSKGIFPSASTKNYSKTKYKINSMNCNNNNNTNNNSTFTSTVATVSKSKADKQQQQQNVSSIHIHTHTHIHMHTASVTTAYRTQQQSRAQSIERNSKKKNASVNNNHHHSNNYHTPSSIGDNNSSNNIIIKTPSNKGFNIKNVTHYKGLSEVSKSNNSTTSTFNNKNFNNILKEFAKCRKVIFNNNNIIINSNNSNQNNNNNNNNNTCLNSPSVNGNTANTRKDMLHPHSHCSQVPNTHSSNIKSKKLKIKNISIEKNPIQASLTHDEDDIILGKITHSQTTVSSFNIITSYIKNFTSSHNGLYPSTHYQFYTYGRLLGKGAFGKVNLCLHLLTGRIVAIKSINKSSYLKSNQNKAKIQSETKIMQLLNRSKHIVQMFETFETKKHLCIVMEYIFAGDLLNYIRKRSRLNEDISKFIFKQLILGLKDIHNKNIVHRDIKLDNILIDLDNKIKICDFGVSHRLKRNDETMTQQCGTPAYIAPEILRDKGYCGFGVDIWSSGIVLYAMLSGGVPFKGVNKEELFKSILNDPVKQIHDISDEANNLLMKLLDKNPDTRINITGILTHPWLITLDNEDINLFTNAERSILGKGNIDYSSLKAISTSSDLELFSLDNINTEKHISNNDKNHQTKSVILAPYNTSLNEDEKVNEIEHYNIANFIERGDGLIEYQGCIKELNRNYELNNNDEIDNGIIKSFSNNAGANNKDTGTPNMNNCYNDKSNLSSCAYSKDISPFINSSLQSQPLSPFNEFNSSVYGDKGYLKEGNEEDKKNKERVLNELEKRGYGKEYLIDCLNRNKMNYATTGFYLLMKYLHYNVFLIYQIDIHNSQKHVEFYKSF